MGRTNYSYNGMLSAIARKSLPRFTVYEKNWTSISTIFGNVYPTLNKRGNDSLTNIISRDFYTPEEYIKTQTTLIGKIYIDSDDFLKATGITSITRGQTYTFYFSSDYGTTVRLSITEDGSDFTEGVTITDTSLTFVVPGTYASNTIYIKSPTTPGLGSSLTVSGTVTSNYVFFNADDNLKIAGITSITRGQTYTFYFSSDYGTSIALSVTEDGSDFTEGVTTTDTSLTFVVPSELPYSTMYIKSPTTPGLGSSLTVSGPLEEGTIYFDNGTLKVAEITSITRGQSYTFYFSSDYGTTVRLSTTEDGTDFTEGVTTTDTSLTFVVPITYARNTIYIKSPTTPGLGSLLIVSGTLKLLPIGGAEEDFFGQSVSISGDGLTAIVGAQGADSYIGAAFIYKYNSGVWSETKITAEDEGAQNDNFGYSVSISGDGLTAIVGAQNDDSFRGSAYIYNYINGAWIRFQPKLTAFERTPTLFGYSVSISNDGLTAIIGAYVEGSYRGAAYIYKYNSGVWTETKITASDGAASDYYGYSVSISGDGLTAIVGAFADNSAYIYKYNSGVWTETKITAGNNSFGYSVSISGDGLTAIVGALSENSAYIYKYINGGWTQQTFNITSNIGTRENQSKLTASDGAASGLFGQSVAISNDGLTAFVGAYADDSYRGAAYIYKYNSGVWTETKITASDGAAYDQFGQSVSISGDGLTAIVGAQMNDDNGFGTGSAYIFPLL